jgi:hypothetical protein
MTNGQLSTWPLNTRRLVFPQPDPLAKTIDPVVGIVTHHRLSFRYGRRDDRI